MLSADVAHGTREVVVSSAHLDTNDQVGGQDTSAPTGPLTQWFDLATSGAGRVRAVPSDPDLHVGS